MTVAAKARSYDGWADAYDRFRPGYPAAIFRTIGRRLDLPPTPRVADLGAGTGRATLAMADIGWQVTAVEPGGTMLDHLVAGARQRGLTVAAVQATAEHTGLPAGSLDLMTAAQAFHWFDRSQAVAEMARVTRSTGGVALFWNVRDTARSPLLAAYQDLLASLGRATETARFGGEIEDTPRGAFADTDAFEPPERITLRHAVQMTAEEFIGVAFTSSFVRNELTAADQEHLRRDVRALVKRHHPDRGPFAVPYRIVLWITRRRPPT